MVHARTWLHARSGGSLASLDADSAFNVHRPGGEGGEEMTAVTLGNLSGRGEALERRFGPRRRLRGRAQAAGAEVERRRQDGGASTPQTDPSADLRWGESARLGGGFVKRLFPFPPLPDLASLLGPVGAPQRYPPPSSSTGRAAPTGNGNGLRRSRPHAALALHLQWPCRREKCAEERNVPKRETRRQCQAVLHRAQRQTGRR